MPERQHPFHLSRSEEDRATNLALTLAACGYTGPLSSSVNDIASPRAVSTLAFEATLKAPGLARAFVTKVHLEFDAAFHPRLTGTCDCMQLTCDHRQWLLMWCVSAQSKPNLFPWLNDPEVQRLAALSPAAAKFLLSSRLSSREPDTAALRMLPSSARRIVYVLTDLRRGAANAIGYGLAQQGSSRNIRQLSWLHFAALAHGVCPSKTGSIEHDVFTAADELDRRFARALALEGFTQKNEPVSLSHPTLDELLPLLIEAGRLQLDDSPGRVLTTAPSRSARLQWLSPDDLHWVPSFHVTGGGLLVASNPLRYVDESGAIGLVEIDWPAESTAALTAIPPLTDRDVESLRALSDSPQAHLSPAYFKALPSFTRSDAGVVRPSVTCMLDWSPSDERFVHPSQAGFLSDTTGSPVALLSFAYPFGTVTAGHGERVHVFRDGMATTVYTRDLDFEEACVQRLKASHKSLLSPGSMRFPAGAWTDEGHRQQCLQIHRALAAEFGPEGWDVKLSALWPSACRPITDYQADFGAEVDGWHSISLTASVDGQQIDMLGFLADCFRDPSLMSAVADPQLPSTALWYFTRPDGTTVSVPLRHLAHLFPLVTGLVGDPAAGYRISKWQSHLVRDLELVLETDLTSASPLRDLLGALSVVPDQLPSRTLAAMALPPRPYQAYAALWADVRRRHGLGGIVADEYAVGKTLQALITLFNAFSEVDGAGATSLVLMDKTLLATGRWQEDAARFFPTMRLLQISETADRGALNSHALSEHAVLTTYDVLEAAPDLFRCLPWNVVVCDEAHRLLNRGTLAYRIVSSLRARQKLVITGNPYVNGPSDIHSLISLTVPGLLPDFAAFNRAFPRLREPSSPTPEDQMRYEEDFVSAQSRLYALGRVIAPFHLARTNEELGRKLPEIDVETVSVVLPEWQANLYEAARVTAEKSISDIVAQYGYVAGRSRILARLMIMRQMCLDPQISSIPGLLANPSLPAKSAKLLELLAQFAAEGKKVVCTSFFTSWISRLLPEISSAGHTCVTITGKTPRRGRASSLARFRSGEAGILFTQTRLAQGWEIPEADVIISLDPWWNAMPELQAVARLRRDERMKMLRFIILHAEGSLEAVIRRMADSKRSHATAFRLGASSQLPALSAFDISEILAPLPSSRKRSAPRESALHAT
jgi:superfamily II DNA or RNA helicase